MKPKVNHLISMNRVLCLTIAVAGFIVARPVAHANTIALDFTGGIQNSVGGTSTVGWAFTTSAPIFLTDLGVWDGPQRVEGGDFTGSVGDGLADPHTVTIWTSTGTFVTSATVPIGTSAPLTDNFRYVSIAPILLPAGNYTIGAVYDAVGTNDTFAFSATTVTTASGITYGGSRSIANAAFPPGDLFGYSNGYFGPNFQFLTQLPTNGNGVPESGSALALMLATALPLIAFHSKLSRRS